MLREHKESQAGWSLRAGQEMFRPHLSQINKKSASQQAAGSAVHVDLHMGAGE